MQEGNDGNNPIFTFPMDLNRLRYEYVLDRSTQLPHVENTRDTGLNYNMNINNITNLSQDWNQWQQENHPISGKNIFQHQEGGGGANLNTYNSFMNSVGGNIIAPQDQSNELSDIIKNLNDIRNQEFATYLKNQEMHLRNDLSKLLDKQYIYYHNFMTGFSQKLQAKEAEIMNMGKMNMGLEERIKQLTIESQSWQTKAKHNESLFFTLRKRLEQSWINIDLNGKERCRDNNEMVSASKNRLVNCINCGHGEIRVLLLPCRHLCLCERCDHALVKVCPVCGVTKDSSIRVLTS